MIIGSINYKMKRMDTKDKLVDLDLEKNVHTLTA